MSVECLDIINKKKKKRHGPMLGISEWICHICFVIVGPKLSIASLFYWLQLLQKSLRDICHTHLIHIKSWRACFSWV